MNSPDLIKKLKSGPLDEYSIKAGLREFGIPVPEGMLCEVLPGKIELNFPLVLKVSDESILHKTEAGGVITGIETEEALKVQFKKMKDRFPTSRILIEEMIPDGVEIIVGVIRDRTFGLTLMLGMGGIYTELYNDVSFRLIPIDIHDASDMIEEVSIGRFIEGFRGQKVDKIELANFLLKISDLSTLMESFLDQLDLNPVKVNGKKVCVLDSKLIRKKI